MGSQYRHYRVEDFVADRHFQRWVQHPEPASDAFWQQWMHENPDRIPLIHEAREIILHLRTGNHDVSEEDISRQLLKLDQRIDRWESQQIRAVPVRRFVPKVYWWAAAAVILLTLSGGGFWIFWQSSPIMLTTNYSETRLLWLPDSSQVVLNSNSTIRFKRQWSTGQTREVWLEGEAYFTVRPQTHSGGKVKFTVHAHDLDVNVLGTRFNVYNRGEQKRVVLTSGKVTLRIADKPSAGQQSHPNQAAGVSLPHTEITMEPGDYVEYVSTQGELVRKTVNPEEHTSWRDGQLKFNFTPLIEVTRIIEETYGYQVIIQDTTVQNKKISGTLPANNVDILLQALKEGFELESTKHNHTIILK